ncbi:MAG: type II toxin-antitoxin system RelE/ParE family toxin [Saprospiraceae bacterium]
MSFDVRLKKSAEKELKNIKSSILSIIDEVLLNLVDDPHPKNSLKIQGEDNLFRIRCAQYRIIYEIDKKSKVIEILAIVNRKDAYKKK